MKDLTRLVRLSNRYKKQMTKDTDINWNYCKFIMFIYNHEGMTQDEIAFAMGIDKSNAARQLSSMEESGYIERRVKKDDKRSLEIYPTDKLKLSFPFVKNLLISWDNYVQSDLTEEEIESLKSIIAKMKQRADKWQEHDFKLPPFPEELRK